MLTIKWLGAISFLAALNCNAAIIDDFSSSSWEISRSTPGKIKQEKNKLYLQDKPGKHGWVTASRSYNIDVDKTPILVIKVDKLSRKGQVKLVRLKPRQKKPVLTISRPGVYTVDMKQVCRWSGKNKIMVMLYAIGDGSDITYSYVKFTDKLSKDELADMKKRYHPPKGRPNFYFVPLFNSCGYYFVSKPVKDVSVWFRKVGGKWEKALDPVYITENVMYRGSIVNLDENTEYEFKIVGGGKILGQKKFKTWNPQVKVAKTVVLDNSNFKDYLKIIEHGKPDGWIKYTAAPGFVLKNDGKTPLIELVGAKYILLEGLTLKGGASKAIVISRCQDVRVANCDISGWGRLGKQRFDKDGKYYNKNGKNINWDGAIHLFRSKNTVVERCYFHDPRNKANSWRYSHPAGPEGMLIERPESTVVRYNDFIGSNEHRWNDAIEGVGNFHKDGGFNRDADIYGNIMTMCNDDCIEIDGGQQNVRVFFNKFENALCGVSIQGCMAGPSYVFQNLFCNMGDEFGTAGQVIKTSANSAGKDAVSFIFNNTITGGGRSLPLHRLFKIVAKNNIFAAEDGVGGRTTCKLADADYNLVTAEKIKYEKHGIIGKYPEFTNEKSGLFKPVKGCPTLGAGTKIDNFTSGDKIDLGAFQSTSNLILPYRPIPVSLDKYQLNFTVKNSKCSGPQTVTATIGGKGFSSDFKIRKNDVFDWFTVTPSSGKLESGQKVTFTVKMHPEMMKQRSKYIGVFLIRLSNGFSRPVSIYATTDNKQEAKPMKKGVNTVFIEADKPVTGKPFKVVSDSDAFNGKCVYVDGWHVRKKPAVYTFDVPETGKYFVLMRIKCEEPVGAHNSVFFSVNGDKMAAANMQGATEWNWCLAANNDKQLMRVKMFKLKKGKNKIEILPREPVYLDLIAVTEDPQIFEPK